MSKHGRLATYSADGKLRYGFVTENGVVNLSSRMSASFPTLKDAIQARALTSLVEEGARHPPD
ncbi:MAG: 2-hydroxyhepta-2,4-diene-1,7-dioate isomerase, partial [Hyphomicrobiales bacterium]|nr:2-hydroxyhepta-2,4-diene-1,7-dioate isomerase [Hyphomicrobiales bacterium]